VELTVFAVANEAPSLLSAAPFAVLLLAIAILPLFHGTHHWWEKNRNKFLISVSLALMTLIYYWLRHVGYHHAGESSEPGWNTVVAVLKDAILADYVPFIVMLFSLYTISGNIRWEIGARPTPLINLALLTVGTVLASFIGTTGAAMLLIRPLLAVNQQRRFKRHTVIFFIFLVANIGGLLLPIGDPPLFLGYLRGVPFLWTLRLLPHWLFCAGLGLAVYFILELLAYRREANPNGPSSVAGGDVPVFRAMGQINYLWLAAAVLSIALVTPGKAFVGTDWIVPGFIREIILLALTGLSWITSQAEVRRKNEFSFIPIGEVASLFIGIFICMVPPLEILQARGTELGLSQPWQFFWITGVLSSFLDNAPTYAVFFETALALQPGVSLPLDPLLIAISTGAVFMGANSYIGNGPNFMVKSIAEAQGVAMPGFFAYMLYSAAILLPIFILVTLLFLI
jgi:Na+/H+ antiporter NhaD/arsenite permease-like protein